MAATVVLAISRTVELNARSPDGEVKATSSDGTVGRGRNQLLPRSKKHRSDQLHEVRKRIRRRMEQYTHGRLRKYVQIKKRNMKAGEALVGMNRSGSQLHIVSFCV
jgi:hypothetical protein